MQKMMMRIFGLVICHLTICSVQAEAAHPDTIEEIVVTARKRAETAQDTPVAITALSEQTIKNYAIESLDDIGSAVPGLIIGETSGAAGGSLYLRGIGSGASNPLIDQAISTNIDGIQVTTGQIRRAAQLDMRQVEVLRGPQALFFGKNSPGGIISITTADPGDELEASLRTGYELEADEVFVEGILSGPISDKIGGRLAISYLESDGFFDVADNGALVPANASAYPETEELFARGTLTIDTAESLSVRAKLTYTTSTIAGGNGVASQRIHCPLGAPQGQPPFPCKADATTEVGGVPLSAIAFDPSARDFSPLGFRDNDQLLASVELKYALSAALSLTSITALYDVDEATGSSFAFGPVNTINSANNTYRLEQLTQEVRLLSEFDSRTNFMLTGFYENRKASAGTSVTVFNAVYVGREVFDQDQKSYSVAAQLIWDLSEDVELTLGGRYTEEEKDIKVKFNGLFVPKMFDAEDWNDFSPEATLSYHPNEAWLLFASYKEGFKSGGFDASFGASGRDPGPYDPEEVDGYEFGAKGLFPDKRLQLNVVLYAYNYEGLQVSSFDTISNTLKISNAAGAEIRGLEADFLWLTPIEGLHLRGGVAYNDNEYTEFFAECYTGQTIALGCNALFNPVTEVFTTQDISGEALEIAPDVVATFGVSYKRTLSNGMVFNVNVDGRYSDGYDGRPGGPDGGDQDGYTTFNTVIGITSRNGHWSAKLIGRNLSDEYAILRSFDTPFTGSGKGVDVATRADVAANLTRGRELMFELAYRL